MIESEEWKILYSGDTAPNRNIVNHGFKSTLLIHEATMEDGLEKNAEEH